MIDDAMLGTNDLAQATQYYGVRLGSIGAERGTGTERLRARQTGPPSDTAA